MKVKYLKVFVLFVFGIAAFSSVNAQSVNDDKQAVRTFVQKFYDWYTVLYSAPVDKKNPIASDIVAIKQKTAYFDVLLRKELIEDADAQSKVNEIVGLDYDPFLNAQDDGFNYQAGNVKQQGNKFYVDIHRAENGKPKKVVLASELCIIAEVSKINGQLVFTNFITPFKHGQHDLLSSLVELRRDRNKSKGKDQ